MSNVLFIACTPVARYMITELLDNSALSSVTVCGIVNLTPEAAANKSNYDNYTDLLAKYKLSIYYCKNINDEDTLRWIKARNPDLIIQSGWSQKFGHELLLIPKYGCIGEHPAPLPKGRGAACVNWAIATGEKNWGNSFFKMVERYDEGEIYAQHFFEITDFDDVATVYDKVSSSSRKIIRENIVNWSNGIFTAFSQDISKATYYKRRKPDDGFFSFDNNATDLYNLIRALTKPYPGAFFIHDRKKIIVWKAVFSTIKSFQPCGSFIGTTVRGGLLVCVKNGEVIELLRIQSENSPEMWATDWYKAQRQ